MNAIFVEPEFEQAANAQLPEFIRLGGREVLHGEHSGKLLVNAEIINSCPEWQDAFQQFASGGTALTEDGVVIEPGRTIEFTSAETTWGPYTIEEVTDEELEEMFNEE